MKFYATDNRGEVLCDIHEVNEKDFVKKHIGYAKKALYDSTGYETIYGHFSNGDVIWISIDYMFDVVSIILHRNDECFFIYNKKDYFDFEDDDEDDWEADETSWYWSTR